MKRIRVAGALALLFWGIFLAVISPVAADLELFSGSSQLSSVGVHDMTQDPAGNVFFATDNCLLFTLTIL